MESFKVICINDKHKPEGFVGDWIKNGQVYEVEEAVHLARQRMHIGYKLSGLNIHPDSKFQYYISTRFKPYTSDDELEAENAVSELLEETLFDYV